MTNNVRVVALAAALAAVAVAASCGSSTKSSGAPSSESTVAPSTTSGASSTSSLAASTTTAAVRAPGPAVPSSGCRAAAKAAHLEKRTMRSGGQMRSYLVTAPAAAATPTPAPLVLDFHGLAEGSDTHAQMSQFGQLAESAGFAVAFPQGSGPLPSWKGPSGKLATDPAPDVDFVAALLDRIEASECIDTSRVYVDGLSNGAMMTSLLACRLADRITAAATVAGITQYDGCAPSRPVPVLAFHGTADPILLFNGGVGDLSRIFGGGAAAGATTAPTSPTTTAAVQLDGPGYPANAKAWAVRNGCDPAPHDSKVSDEVTLRTFTCPAGADVQMYIIAGGGHAWPGSEFSRQIAAVVGPTTFDIDATQLIWQFFQRFRLP